MAIKHLERDHIAALGLEDGSVMVIYGFDYDRNLIEYGFMYDPEIYESDMVYEDDELLIDHGGDRYPVAWFDNCARFWDEYGMCGCYV